MADDINLHALHGGLALGSYGLVLVHCYLNTWQKRGLGITWLKILPHAVDILLLITGILLMVTQALSPNTPWLQLKLWLTVGYIVLSLVTVRTANKALRWVTGTGVLLCLLGMVGLVYGKSLPW